MKPLSAIAVQAMNQAQQSVNLEAVHIHITSKAKDMTNDSGRAFIDSTLRFYKGERTFTSIIDGPSNWFLLIDSDSFAYAIPYRHTSCVATTFGDKQHVEKYLRSIAKQSA